MNTQIALLIAVSVAVGMIGGYYQAYTRGRKAFYQLLSSSIHSTTTMGNAAMSLLVDELKISKEDAIQKLLNRCREYGMNPVAVTATGKEMKPNVNETK